MSRTTGNGNETPPGQLEGLLIDPLFFEKSEPNEPDVEGCAGEEYCEQNTFRDSSDDPIYIGSNDLMGTGSTFKGDVSVFSVNHGTVVLNVEGASNSSEVAPIDTVIEQNAVANLSVEAQLNTDPDDHSKATPAEAKDLAEPKAQENASVCHRGAHIRKSLKPRKLSSFADPLLTSTTDVEASISQDVLGSTVIETASDTVDHLSPSNNQLRESTEVECRRSLRARRTVKQLDAFENEAELDRILSDKVNLQVYGPTQHWNTGDYITNKWVAVERILAHRLLKPKKITKSLSEAMNSYPVYQQDMVKLEYFVKFHEQSYWHCAWVPGAILLALHPSMVRYYHKQLKSKPLNTTSFELACETSESEKRDEIVRSDDDSRSAAVTAELEADLSCEKVSSSTGTLPHPDASDDSASQDPSIPNTVTHSSEEVTDEENQIGSCNDYDDVLNWTSKVPSGAGARRRYLIRWGVQSYTLVPERILTVGKHFSPVDSKHKTTRLHGHQKSEKVLYRHVLVKWLHMPPSHSTWEIIEADMDSLLFVASCTALAGLKSIKPPEEPEQKLLPLLVRRHLIRMTDLYLTRIACMLCEAYGTGKVPSKQLTTVNDLKDFWKTHWANDQPSYLSPVCKRTLHPYQVEGVRWLWQAYHNRVNAILADEMGLGKTVQVIALLSLLWKEHKDYGPFIVIAPLSTLLNWEREFQIWAPEFHVIVYAGEKSSRAVMQEYEFCVPFTSGLAAFHVLITSHELACIERSCLQTFHWSVLVVDEAHRLKNKQSRLFKETSQYKADFKILLTGTPLQNTLEELFHLLNFVDPKTFASFKSLSEKWLDMPKEERIAHLHQQLKHHLLRRLKVDVIRDLPKKTEILVFVDLTTLQRKLYKLVLTKNYEELRSGSLMNSLMHLQKVCDHPYLLSAGDNIAPRLNSDEQDSPYEPHALIQVSGKLVVLVDLLSGLRSRGHRVLLYSRLTTMLDILEEVVTNAGYIYERFDGSVKGPARQIAIDRFNAPNSKAFVFLLSTRAGGEGINLASADTVILFDSDWNPQCDLQALSRAHRIGQSRHVVVYRFVTRNTIEERIHYVARRKLALTNLVVDQQQQRKQHRNQLRQQDGETEGPLGGNENHSSSSVGSSHHGTVKENALADSSTAVSLSSEVAPVGNRLTRGEMHEMLRYGVESLFALDDSLDDSELFKAARDRASDDSKRIVYDAEAIAHLLDRSNLTADKEEPTTEADEYLSAFRVAHFDQADEATVSSPSVSADNSSVCESQSGLHNNVALQGSESIECSKFWDRLLRERYLRLYNAENKLCETSGRVKRGVRKYSCEQSANVMHPSEHSPFNPAGVTRKKSQQANSSDQATCPSLNKFPGCEDSHLFMIGSHQPSESENDPEEQMGDTTRNAAASRRRVLSSNISEDSSLSSDVEQADEGLVDDDDDPLYVPSEDSMEDAPPIRGIKQKYAIRAVRGEHPDLQLTTNCDAIEPPPSVTGDDDDQVELSWKPTLNRNQSWKQCLLHIDQKISFHNGQMFIYDFGPHDRQAFAGAVMRFGLPPPGIIPPQNWLPPSLYRKSLENLFAYTSVFMRHLYDDPNGMDEAANCWSDGLPKENLCVPAVLSRIAIMSLIRNKVLEFEDVNGVHSRTFEAVSTRFKFTIHDGGLTLLRPTWHEEWQRINQIVKPAATSTQSWKSATQKREEAMYHLQHIWHSRHDFWLLAGIHVHGYLRWTDILSDPRFHLLCTGVVGVVENMEPDYSNSPQGRIPESLSSAHNISKVHGFLLTRLRMLEQALVVEQALREVARAALSNGEAVSDPPLTRVQNLTVCLSNKLAAAGPSKRIALPRQPRAREATRNAVTALQEILEDFYADLPGLPAHIVFTDTDGASPSGTLTDQTPDTNPFDSVTHGNYTHPVSEMVPITSSDQYRLPNSSDDPMFIEISDDDS